jgi:two-component system, chemotaxis family, CheB/CheR fusion protein
VSGQARPFSIVGIGASAGGLQPLEALVERLKPGRLVYVVLQHLAASGDEKQDRLLRDLLARKTSLNVRNLEDKAKLEADTIYIAPPATEIVFTEGTVRVSAAGSRNPIDTLFRSLAEGLGSEAIGVVLSGTGSDGAVGLKAIRAEGGVTFAQEPNTAEQSGMPLNALNTGVVDFCLGPAEIGDELLRLGNRPPGVPRPTGPMYDEQVVRQICELLHKRSGVDFGTYKLATIERRLERRMAVQKVEAIGDYFKLLENNRTEVAALYDDLLIGVTAFFRDSEPFEALKTIVLPRLLDDRSVHAPLRIWVAGCATGEEAYSIGMSILEHVGDRADGHRAQIFATDVDEDALVRARLGVYDKSIDLTVSPSRLQRFFVKHDRGYQISRQVRDMVVFARHNLGKDPPYSRLDLITCRNVLIYMQPPLQKKVLRTFHYSLNPDGFLLLGTSESVGEAEFFSLMDRKLKIWAKKNMHGRPVFDFAAPATPQLHGTERQEHRATVSVQQLADRKVVEMYGPPGVLIADNLEVIQFRGHTGPYLAPSPGMATLNVLKLIRPELMVPLRTTVDKAMREDARQSSPPTELVGEHGPITVVLDVMPLHEGGRPSTSLLVLFRESPLQMARVVDPMPPTVETRVQELERELLTTKEYLQTSIGDLAATNEELQSSNEELQSSNEELQSSNEELETSKEELQSTNEELTTVNEELQNRMKQLSVASDDLQNVLANATSAVVLVDKDNTIRRYSIAAARLLHLLPGDVGRSISSLNMTLKMPIDTIISTVIETNRERELRFQSYDTSWYTLRVLPYVTAESSIRGAVLDFTRAKLARPLDQPIEVHELVGKVLSSLPHVLVLLDEQLRMVWANKAFFDAFQVGAESLGQPLDLVWTPRKENEALFRLLEKTASEGAPFEGLTVEHPFGRSSAQAMKFSAQALPADGDRPALTLMVMEETK